MAVLLRKMGYYQSGITELIEKRELNEYTQIQVLLDGQVFKDISHNNLLYLARITTIEVYKNDKIVKTFYTGNGFSIFTFVICENYLVAVDSNYDNFIQIWKLDGGNECIKLFKHPMKIMSMITYQNLVYMSDSRSKTEVWGFINGSFVHLYTMSLQQEMNKSIVHKEHLYFTDGPEIYELGEYYSRHYDDLPLCQKAKIRCWRQYVEQSKKNKKHQPIQKDLAYLFERELLSRPEF